jgi:hypothetical protein
MKTEELIDVLASEAPGRRWMPERLLFLALIASLIASGSIFAATIGVRPDFSSAFTSVRFIFKFAVTIAVAASAFVLVRRSLYPESSIPVGLLLAGPVLLGLGIAGELVSLDQSAWGMAATGKNWYLCLTIIPALGIVPLGLIIAALRSGAPSRPGLAGFCAGVLAGGIAATLYAANCTDDSPLFVATWYPIAIGILALFGAVLGRWFARW